jgi:hypothetical protein
MMRQFLVLALVVFGLLGPAVVAWCEGGMAPAPGLPPQAGSGLQPMLTTSELVVGHNRLAFGLLQEHKLLDEAEVVVRVYELHGQQAQLKAQVPAPYTRLEVVEQGKRVHVHPDGKRHMHNEATDVRGIYVTQVTFERPGPWGLEVLARQGDGPVAVSRFTINVLTAPRTPAPGTPAPRSHNLIASDVQDLRQIDTSDPPDPRLHQVRIADAIAQGKPQVIVFATPKFCTSRVCGPVVDIVRTLLPTYGARVVFTHQEIWQDAAAHKFFPTMVQGTPRLRPDGRPDIRTFCVPIEVCEILDTWYTAGLRGTGSHGWQVTNVFVPEAQSFPVLFDGPSAPGCLSVRDFAAYAGPRVTAVALGIARDDYAHGPGYHALGSSCRRVEAEPAWTTHCS